MPQVEVNINGRRYQIACGEGQEDHLSKLAVYIDGRVREMAAAFGQVGDARLLVMVGLLVADELLEARAALSTVGRASYAEGPPAPASRDDDAGLAARIEAIAARIDGIAAELERA